MSGSKSVGRAGVLLWMGLIRAKASVMFECGQLWVGGLYVRYLTNVVYFIVKKVYFVR